MANAQRGEVGFEALGKIWTMKLGTNAMCEIEDATGQSINAIAQKLNSEDGFSIKLMRTLFECGMASYHQDMSSRLAGDIIDDIGFEKASEVMTQAFAVAIPEDKGGTPKGNQKAARA